MLAIAPALLQRSLLGRLTFLELETPFGVAVSHAVRGFLLMMPFAILGAVLVHPLAGIAIAAAVAVVRTWRQTLLPEIVVGRRFQRAIDERDRAAMLHAGRALIDASERRGARQWGGHVILKVGDVLVASDATAAAEAILSAVSLERFPPAPQWRLVLALALYRIKLGRFADARKALASFELAQPPTADIERDYRYRLALIDAATGEPQRALERMRADDGQLFDIVQAHAYAALRRDDDARQALERVQREELGDRVLDVIANGHGPGGRIARELLGLPEPEPSGPAYR